MALSARRSRIVFAVIGVAMVTVGVLVVWFVPRGRPDSLVSRLDGRATAPRIESMLEAHLGEEPAEAVA